MNIKVLTWLLKHRELLMAVVEAAKGWDKDAPYVEQWSIVDRIARLVLPVVQKEAVTAKQLWGYTDDELSPLSLHDGDVALLQAGAEVQAMGIDWKLFVEVVLPIVISILEAIVGRR
jgi:hypothetical protein